MLTFMGGGNARSTNSPCYYFDAVLLLSVKSRQQASTRVNKFRCCVNNFFRGLWTSNVASTRRKSDFKHPQHINQYLIDYKSVVSTRNPRRISGLSRGRHLVRAPHNLPTTHAWLAWSIPLSHMGGIYGGIGSGSIEFLTHSENGPIIISQELIESVLFMFESSMCFLAYRKKLN